MRLLILVGAALVAVIAGCAVLIGLAAQQTTTKLAPQGEYRSFEEAEKASGYHIPRPVMPDTWKLDGIDVSGQLTGVCFRDRDKCMDNDNRYVAYSYLLEGAPSTGNVPGRRVLIEMSRGDEVVPAGQTEEPVQLRGKTGKLVRFEINGRASATLQWREGELRISAAIDVPASISAADAVPPGSMSLERLLTVLETMK